MSHESVPNLTATEWSVDIFISEHDGNTHAEARLHTGTESGLVGNGSARLAPEDYDVPEIGFEIAAARALVDLGHRLSQTADDDVAGVSVPRLRPKA